MNIEKMRELAYTLESLKDGKITFKTGKKLYVHKSIQAGLLVDVAVAINKVVQKYRKKVIKQIKKELNK